MAEEVAASSPKDVTVTVPPEQPKKSKPAKRPGTCCMDMKPKKSKPAKRPGTCCMDMTPGEWGTLVLALLVYYIFLIGYYACFHAMIFIRHWGYRIAILVFFLLNLAIVLVMVLKNYPKVMARRRAAKIALE